MKVPTSWCILKSGCRDLNGSGVVCSKDHAHERRLVSLKQNSSKKQFMGAVARSARMVLRLHGIGDEMKELQCARPLVINKNWRKSSRNHRAPLASGAKRINNHMHSEVQMLVLVLRQRGDVTSKKTSEKHVPFRIRNLLWSQDVAHYIVFAQQANGGQGTKD